MLWIKYTIHLKGGEDSGYVDLDTTGYSYEEIDDYWQDVHQRDWPHVEYFRVDYDKVDFPPSKWLMEKVKELGSRIRGTQFLIDQYGELLHKALREESKANESS